MSGRPIRCADPGGPARWHVTVIEDDGEGPELLFQAGVATQGEAEALAAEARRLRADVTILIRPPAGSLYRWG
jgi:hypothetical protein